MLVSERSAQSPVGQRFGIREDFTGGQDVFNLSVLEGSRVDLQLENFTS